MIKTPDDAIARLNTLYGAPTTDDLAGFIDEYRRSLSGFSPEAIQHGLDYAVRNNPRPFWPPVGAIYQAMKAKQDDIDAAARAKRDLEEAEKLRAEAAKRQPFTPEQAERIRKLHAECIAALKAVSLDEDAGRRPQWERGQRPAFEAMMRNSPNQSLYRKGH